MSDTTSEPHEDCDLGWSVAMSMRNYRAQVGPVFADFPRGARGYQLLYTVARKQIRTQVQLADYLGVDRTVITYVIDDLVEAGLVDRRADPTDRRVRTVVVTQQGAQRLRELQSHLEKAEVTFFEPLDEQEQVQFRNLLSRVARHARDDSSVARDAARSEIEDDPTWR